MVLSQSRFNHCLDHNGTSGPLQVNCIPDSASNSRILSGRPIGGAKPKVVAPPE